MRTVLILCKPLGLSTTNSGKSIRLISEYRFLIQTKKGLGSRNPSPEIGGGTGT